MVTNRSKKEVIKTLQFLKLHAYTCRTITLNTKGLLMKINAFILTLLSSALLFACDDEDSSTSDDSTLAGAEQSDASIDAGSEPLAGMDSEIPIQTMQFDTMEIEPDPDMGPDMDD